jgi:hypothetical protein
MPKLADVPQLGRVVFAFKELAEQQEPVNGSGLSLPDFGHAHVVARKRRNPTRRRTLLDQHSDET